MKQQARLASPVRCVGCMPSANAGPGGPSELSGAVGDTAQAVAGLALDNVAEQEGSGSAAGTSTSASAHAVAVAAPKGGDVAGQAHRMAVHVPLPDRPTQLTFRLVAEVVLPVQRQLPMLLMDTSLMDTSLQAQLGRTDPALFNRSTADYGSTECCPTTAV